MTTMRSLTLTLLLAALALLLCAPTASAFLPSASIHRSVHRAPRSIHRHPPLPPSTSSPSSPPISTLSPTPHHSSPTQLQSFFGLGPAELLIIALAGLVLVGPSKLLEFTREAGSVAGKTAGEMGEEWSDLKAIPEEFRKGVEEGEIEARSRKAKEMEEVGGGEGKD